MGKLLPNSNSVTRVMESLRRFRRWPDSKSEGANVILAERVSLPKAEAAPGAMTLP